MSSTQMGSDRVREKLRRCITDKNYYEAHQMFRSLYFRYTTARRYTELIGLMFDGAEGLLTEGQMASGWDLANLFVETLNNAQAPVDQLTLERLERLFKLLHTTSQSDLVDRNVFVAAVVKWSVSIDPQYKHGHPSIHGRFAFALWQEQDMKAARYHFLLSQDGEGCAAFLLDFQRKFAFRSEVDLLIAQAVFQLLCNRSEAAANAAFNGYTAKHPDIRGINGKPHGPPFNLPLLNFVWFLLLAINETQNDARKSTRKNPVGMFGTLVEKYQPSIHRDPSYSQYLDKIGQMFFGLPPPPSKQQSGGMGGFLTNFLQTFVGGGGDNATAALLNGPEEESSDEGEEMTTERPTKSQTRVKIDEELD